MLDDLEARIAAQRVVVFVGTGVSWGASSSPLAGWKGFLEAGIHVCEAVLGPSLPPGWAERQRAALEAGDLDEWLNVAEAFPASSMRRAAGSFDAGYETNYDNLLEDVIARRAITWRDDNDVTRFVQDGRLDDVLHVHGHWRDSTSVVLGVRSYEGIAGHEHAQSTLRTLLMTHTAVFVGYGEGLGDPNFGALRSWAATVLRGVEHRHYRLCLASEAARIARDHEGERILPLVYGDSHDQLEPFVRARIPDPS